MGKRFWSLVLTSALIAGVFVIAPAKAQEAPAVTVPEVVQIDDPVDDANYLNDQSLLNNVPPTQDNGTPADASGTSDLLKVWYTTDAETISVNIQTQVAPPASAGSYIYRVYSNPGEGSVATSTLGCLRFFVFMPSGNPPVGGYSGPLKAGLLDYCDKGINYTTDAAEGKLTITEMPDGTGVMTITVPRSYSPKLADGQVLTAPMAQVQNLAGTGTDGNGQPIPATDGSLPGGNWRRGPQIDNSKIGTDYTISSGGGAGPVVLDPGKPAKPAKPSKPTPTGKDCGKGKSKGQGNGPKKCPKPGKPKPPAGCAPYVPGEEGKDAGDTVLVTDAATAEKPVETTIEIMDGVGIGGVFEDLMSTAFKNVQVDPAAAGTGLYVRLEMPIYADYDLYVNNPDGSTAARAAGFNPEPAVYNDTEMGGHTEQGAEVIDGLASADCQGYTLRVAAASAEGGELTIKLWLGEATYTASGSEGALATFYSLLGI